MWRKMWIGCIGCILAGWMADGLQAAQVTGGRVAFSLSGSGDLANVTAGKEEVLEHDSLMGTRLLFTNEAISFLVGDVTGDGKEDFFDNIDALHVTTAKGEQMPTALYFSVSKDMLGVKDGDILHFKKYGGITPFLTEDNFLSFAGLVDGNCDVDAFSISEDGDLYFSFAENEESSLLPSGQPGEILDGDILFMDGATGVVELLYTEDQVSAMVSQALGATTSIGDVLSLAYDDASQALLFTVQSPTSNDASVFSDEGGGSLVSGLDEESLGFSNEVEIDALSLMPLFADMPSLEVEPRYPAQGDTFTLKVEGGMPLNGYCVLYSGAINQSSQLPAMGGFGPLVLDMAHPYFIICGLELPYLTGQFDSVGAGTFSHTLPAALDAVDIYVQVYTPAAHVLSHPVTLEINQ